MLLGILSWDAFSYFWTLLKQFLVTASLTIVKPNFVEWSNYTFRLNIFNTYYYYLVECSIFYIIFPPVTMPGYYLVKLKNNATFCLCLSSPNSHWAGKAQAIEKVNVRLINHRSALLFSRQINTSYRPSAYGIRCLLCLIFSLSLSTSFKLWQTY
jgi:hypothetical protein